MKGLAWFIPVPDAAFSTIAIWKRSSSIVCATRSALPDIGKSSILLTHLKIGIVLLSGGLDSTTTATYAKSLGYSLTAMTVHYGQTLNKEIKSVNQSVDSLSTTLKKEIKIEGLKSEKRMIQATDRKMMDVNRQTEIDKEISELQK